MIALAGALLFKVFAGVDLRAAALAIVHIGPLAPLALLPFALSMLVDAVAQRWLFIAMGRPAPFARILSIRFGTEAIHLSAPAGFVVGDSTAAALFDQRCGVPLAQGTTAVVARRWLVMRAHSAYIALGAAVGWGALVAVSLRVFGRAFLPWVVLASSCLPLAISVLLGASFRPGGPVAALVAAACRAPWAPLRARAERCRAGATSAHASMKRIGVARAATWAATTAFFGCWLLEACDTAIVLRLLGAPPDFAVAMAAEVGISLVRAIGGLAPAGLGVQDVGYAALFPAMGLRPETAAAFVVVKRAKEAVWIGVGYLLLALERRAAARSRPSRLAPQSVGCVGTRAASNGMQPLVNDEQAL